MSPRFILGRENLPCVAEVVNRSFKADCTDFNPIVCIGLKAQMKCFFFIAEFERAAEFRKMAIYRFLLSCLVSVTKV